MKVSTLLLALPVSFVLFACSSSPSTPPKPLSDQRQINEAVWQAAEESNVIPRSVLRDDDKVFLALRLQGLGDKASGEVYLQADCVNGGVDWVYADVVDKTSSPVKEERRYTDGGAFYSPPAALSESVAGAVHRLDSVKKACERTPSWREIAYNKKNETQLLLEVSSLQTQGDGSVLFWAAVDYPYLAFIRQHKAPYARRAGFYQVDCQEQTFSLLHVYYLNQQHTVTDGGMQVRPPVLNIQQATGDSATMLATVCGGGDELSQSLLPPEQRGKRLPNFSALPDVHAGVADQLTQLKRIPPKQSISSLRVEGTRSSLTGSAAARLNRPVFFQQEVFIETTQIPGVYYVTWQEGNDRTEQMSFLGMIPASQMLYSAEEQNVFQIDRLEMRGDWEKMPVNSQLAYKQRARITDIVTNQSNRESEVICRVAREGSADNLHQQFQGKAKELKCHTVGGKIDEISTYYCLEDYGFCLLLGSRSGKYVLNSRVTEVR
ncbi:MAG: hypothetical protein FWD51_03360 [Betaproteobacteria bacterium]|nr:hypothetical protein [Betaproteobacteria bacterium]